MKIDSSKLADHMRAELEAGDVAPERAEMLRSYLELLDQTRQRRERAAERGSR